MNIDDLDAKTLRSLRQYFSSVEKAEILKLKKIIKAQDQTISSLEGSKQAIKHLAGIQTPKPIKRRLKKGGKPAKAFQLHLSDTHSREIVTLAQTDGHNEHNADIGRERLRSIMDQAITIIKEESRTCTPVHATVWGGGDFNVNADLHYKMERCVDEEPLVEMEHLYEMLNEELGYFWGKVPTLSNSFVGSFSNHGRDTAQIVPGLESARSYDSLIYKRLKKDFPQIKFTIGDTPFTVEEVCGYRTMYHHGHGRGMSPKRSSSGILVPAWARYQELRQAYSFDAIVMGHLHTAGVVRGNQFASMHNGSLVGFNSYAASEGYAPEPPSQNLAVIDLENGTVEKVYTLYA